MCTSILIFTFFLSSLNLCAYNNPYWRPISPRRPLVERDYVYRGLHWAGEIAADVARLGINLFSVDTAKIITAVTPFYLTTRMVDEQVQSCFYDVDNHKNVHQLHSYCHSIAKNGVGVPMVLLSSMALFVPDPDLRLTARIFALGLPFVHSGKDIIKNLKFKCCLRPWHEDFSSKKRASGGFPSGHVANVTYMATLFGMRHGPKWAIPLGLFGIFVGVDFLNCNRHYLSQLVAGAGLGMIFAFAASKVVDTKLAERYNIAVSTSGDGVGLTYFF